MAPPLSDISLSEDDDAPETFTLAQSRKAERERGSALKRVELATSLKKKAQNRVRDRRLKEQAENSKRKRHASERTNKEDVEARMERALREAEEELDEYRDAREGSMEEEFMGVGNLGKSAHENLSENEDGDVVISRENFSQSEGDSGSDEEEEDPEASAESGLPKYLPDHVFASAFGAQAVLQSSISGTSSGTKKTKLMKKRARRTRSTSVSSKDVIVGNRVLRTLDDDAYPQLGSAMRTAPPRKVKKFLKRTLNLNGAKSRTKGWERKTANLGVMKRSGPAHNFVRGQ